MVDLLSNFSKILVFDCFDAATLLPLTHLGDGRRLVMRLWRLYYWLSRIDFEMFPEGSVWILCLNPEGQNLEVWITACRDCDGDAGRLGLMQKYFPMGIITGPYSRHLSPKSSVPSLLAIVLSQK